MHTQGVGTKGLCTVDVSDGGAMKDEFPICFLGDGCHHLVNNHGLAYRSSRMKMKGVLRLRIHDQFRNSGLI